LAGNKVSALTAGYGQLLPRVIPVLLLQEKEVLVKSRQFSHHVYVGDPLNAVKIFNEKEVDELIVLDITASKQRREPYYDYVEQIASECFMPVTYGGGVATVDQVRKLIGCGVEKVALNTAAIVSPAIIEEAAARFGSSSVVASVDVKKPLLKRRTLYSHCGCKPATTEPVEWVKKLESLGAGELLLQSVDRDGMMQGFDLDLIESVSHAVSIPVIACGGGNTLEDFKAALHCGASAVAAGSRFVFYGKHRAVLINYLSHEELEQLASP
jgi:cyclase